MRVEIRKKQSTINIGHTTERRFPLNGNRNGAVREAVDAIMRLQSVGCKTGSLSAEYNISSRRQESKSLTRARGKSCAFNQRQEKRIRLICLFSGQSIVERCPPKNVRRKVAAFVQRPPELAWAADTCGKIIFLLLTVSSIRKGAVKRFGPSGLLIVPVSIAEIGIVSERKLLEEVMQRTTNNAILFSRSLFASLTAHPTWAVCPTFPNCLV